VHSSMTAMEMSLSKQAVHIINVTNGLCAHPIHHHSFTAVGSSSLFAPAAGVSLFSAPTCLIVGTFHKCIACHNRLGSRPQKSEVASREDSSSGMEMLYCVACGVYAHRSCAFTLTGGEFPSCEVNKPYVESALGLIEQQTGTDVPNLIESPKSKSSWSIFGRGAADDNERTTDITTIGEEILSDHNAQNKNIDASVDEETRGNEPAASDLQEVRSSWSIFRGQKDISSYQQNESTINISTQQPHDTGTGHEPLHPNQCDALARSDTQKEKSSWHFFGRRHGVKVENEDKVNYITNDVSPNQQSAAEQSNLIGCDSEHPRTWCPHVSISRPESPTSWSIFGRKSARNDKSNDVETEELNHDNDATDPNRIDTTSIEHDELPHTHDALERLLVQEHETSELKQAPGVPPQGAFRTSIDIIRKSSQTTANIPKAYSIGMVAGGVAGLAIAGPAG
jgi:hypothetical protein